MTYYRVKTWEPVSDRPQDGYRWYLRVVRVTKWRLRAVIRRLREFYDDANIRVERW